MNTGRTAGIGKPFVASRFLLALCGGLAFVSGCAESELPTYYGQSQVPLIGASVNGTDVLAGMFSEEGHTVAFRRSLISSDLESVDAIVWFPNDYACLRPSFASGSTIGSRSIPGEPSYT